MGTLHNPNVGEGAGTGWVDQPPNDDEIRALVAKVGEQQRRVAESERAQLGGQIDRGQHQKQVFAAFGTLRIRDEIPSALRQGPFARPAAYRVECRFPTDSLHDWRKERRMQFWQA